ncbi:response regulator [Pseudalkalibacillus hwajinpoensis]|uniref:Transcriptional regulatory protein n=1 Tax=Guptibacillus hwajinpoensis TaxID=208199 RepID=A0A4U1MP80_9BACL|nr:response regulator [Pseudalkalibacillus hwajinpoensis]TKD72674.1 response regulator [Pseudalkalibacillus hwajinpoensis]
MVDVLLIEDDPMVQEVNRQFIERVDGFRVVGTAHTGEEGMKFARKLQAELIILDVYMPAKNGVETLKMLRQEGINVEVIAVTAANDRHTIRTMLHHGARDYIIKPFKFERLQQALNNFLLYKSSIDGQGKLTQKELDQLKAVHIHNDKTVDVDRMPKGLNYQTMKQIISYLGDQQQPLSAEEAADGIGIARVTARRYLDYLQKSDKVQLDIQYGGVGRPLNRYSLVKSSSKS